jgi:hypothetical protein
VALSACLSSTDPLAQIKESDVVGTWQAIYADSHANVDPSGIERIVLRGDGTYQQTYTDGSGYRYKSEWNKWYMDSDRLIHLERGRWFPLGIDDSERAMQGQVLSMKIRGKDVFVELVKEIILIVTYSGEQLTLEHLPIAELDVPGIVSFQQVQNVTPQPSATLSPP